MVLSSFDFIIATSTSDTECVIVSECVKIDRYTREQYRANLRISMRIDLEILREEHSGNMRPDTSECVSEH